MNRQPPITLDPEDIKWYRQQRKQSLVRGSVALLSVALLIIYLMLLREGVRFSGTLLLALAGIAGAGIRIAWLERKLRNRLAYLQQAEEWDSITFYDEIDDYSARYEVKRSAVFVFVLFVSPMALMTVLLKSYADEFSLIVAGAAVLVGFIYIANKTDDWLK